MSTNFNKNKRSIIFWTSLLVVLVPAFYLCFSLSSVDFGNHYAYGHALPVTYLPPPNSIIAKSQPLPSNVTISFSERPDPKISTIQVLNSNDQRVDNNDFKITGLHGNRQATVSLDKNKLKDGIYTVSWMTLSADDGHIAKGSYVFGIGNVAGGGSSSAVPSGSSNLGNKNINTFSQQNQIKTEAVTSDLDGIVKWPLIIAQSAIVGGIISHLFLWTNNRFINKVLIYANKDNLNSIEKAGFKPLKIFVLVLCLCSASIFICGTALIFLQIIDLSTSSSSFLSIFVSLLEGSNGQVWITRSSASLIVAITSILYYYLEKKRIKKEQDKTNGHYKISDNTGDAKIKRHSSVFLLYIALIAGAVGIFANSMTSHNSAVDFLPDLAISLDWMHFMAVSIWLGGLFYISTVLLTLAKNHILVDSIKIKKKGSGDILSGANSSITFDDKYKNKKDSNSSSASFNEYSDNSSYDENKDLSITKGDYFLALLIPRFSLLATISLGVIGVSGLYMAWIHLHSFDALFDTLYGNTLVIKLLTVLPVVVLGGYHQFILHKYMVNLTSVTKKRDAEKKAEEGILSKEKKTSGFLSNKIKISSNERFFSNRNEGNINDGDIDLSKSRNYKKDEENKMVKGKGLNAHSVYSRFSKTIKIESLLGIAALFVASILTITSPPASMNMPMSMMTMGVGSGNSTMTGSNMNANSMNQNQHVLPSSAMPKEQNSNNNPNVSNQKLQNSSYTSEVNIMDINTKLQINPFYSGFNTFKVTFVGTDGKPAQNISNVILQFTNDEAGIGPIVVNLNKISEGTYSTFGGYLSQKGNWTIQLTAQRINAYDLNNEFDVTVKSPPPVSSSVSSVNSLQSSTQKSQHKSPSTNTLSTAPASSNSNMVNPPESAPSFDSFAILAIVLAGLVIFGSAYYFRKSKQQLQQTIKMFDIKVNDESEI